MKVTHSLLALSLALAPLTAGAYQKAENIDQAKTMVTDDGYAVVMYARDWDKYSKKTAELMLADPAVTKALGNAVVMQLDVPNVTPKEEHEQNKQRFGGLNLDFPNVYPAIVLYDKTGRRLTDICIPYSERKNPTAVAEKIAVAMAAARKQAKLLAKAESAQGVEKARLLGEAASVPGVNRPANVGRTMQQLDPENKSGMYEVATLNLFATAIESADTKDWEADLARMEKLMKNPLLTTDQKQQACCIAIGLLRRHGGIARMDDLKAMIARLRSLNPDSILGKAAIDAERLWVKEFTLAQGWTPELIPVDTNPVEVKGAIPISAAGTYEVTFTYTRGTHAARIIAVELYDGQKKVAEDRHVGTTGHKHSNNTYKLNVSSNVKKPRLLISFDMKTERDSHGKITVTKK